MGTKRKKLVLLKGDRSLWIIIGVLCVISILVVYSATASMAYRAAGGDTTYYVLRQLRFVAGGFFTIIVVHWLDYKVFMRYSRIAFRISLMLVLLAYFIGVNLNDAARWIKVPIIGLTFQPSDVLKITLVMVLAVALGHRQGIIDRIPIIPALNYGAWKRQPHKNIDIFNKTTKPLIMPIFWAAMVVLPSNLSTAAILVFVSMVVLWVGRVRPSQIGRLIWVAVVSIVLIVSMMKMFGVGRADTWISRVESFVAPATTPNGTVDEKNATDEFQKEQAKIAVASGGVIGKGPGNSTQRSQLPHPYSDFAYAFIIEEYGVVGGAVIFLLYLWIFYRCGVIVRRCTRPSGALLVLGLSLMITFQAFINMLVSVGLVPVTGQALPLISLGGSSVIFTCISFGLILSVSRQTDQEIATATALAAAGVTIAIATDADGNPLLPDEPPKSKDASEQENLIGNEDSNHQGHQQAQDDNNADNDDTDDDPFIVVENPYQGVAKNHNRQDVDLY